MLKHVGNLFEGVGQIGRATKIGQTLEQANQRKRMLEINELFDILKGNFSVQDKENAARKLIQMVQPKMYEQRLSQDPQARFYQPQGQDLATPEQRTEKYLDPSGYSNLRSRQTKQYTPVDQITDLAKIQTARDKFTTVDKKGNQVSGMPKETEEAFNRAEQYVLQRDNRQLFEGGDFVDPIDKAIKAAGGRQTLPKTGQTEKEFPQAGDYLTYDPQTGQPTSVTTEQGMEKIGGHSFQPGAAKGPGVEPDVTEYFQVPTETVPEENIPKTHEDLGLTSRRTQQEFEEVRAFAEKNIKNFNIAQSYLDNKEHYEKLFQAMREGVPDGKGGTRRLTKQEIIKILQNMGK